MPPHIAENLSTIKLNAQRLNAVADEATRYIRDVEKLLTDAGAGIETEFVHVVNGIAKNLSGHMANCWYAVGFGRDNDGKFALIVQCIADATDEERKPVPDGYGGFESDEACVVRLDQAPRDVRIASVKKIPEVVQLIADTIEKTTEELRKDLAEVSAGTAELKAAIATQAETTTKKSGKLPRPRPTLVETRRDITNDDGNAASPIDDQPALTWENRLQLTENQLAAKREGEAFAAAMRETEIPLTEYQLAAKREMETARDRMAEERAAMEAGTHQKNR